MCRHTNMTYIFYPLPTERAKNRCFGNKAFLGNVQEEADQAQDAPGIPTR